MATLPPGSDHVLAQQELCAPITPAIAHTRHQATFAPRPSPKIIRRLPAAARNARRFHRPHTLLILPRRSPANDTSRAQTLDVQPLAHRTFQAAATSAHQFSTAHRAAHARTTAGRESLHHTGCRA